MNKITNGWSIIEESCYVCNYALIISPDNEKSCISCKMNESKNYHRHLDNQFNDFLINFSKLSTPSRAEFAKHFTSALVH